MKNRIVLAVAALVTLAPIPFSQIARAASPECIAAAEAVKNATDNVALLDALRKTNLGPDTSAAIVAIGMSVDKSLIDRQEYLEQIGSDLIEDNCYKPAIDQQ